MIVLDNDWHDISKCTGGIQINLVSTFIFSFIAKKVILHLDPNTDVCILGY